MSMWEYACDGATWAGFYFLLGSVTTLAVQSVHDRADRRRKRSRR